MYRLAALALEAMAAHAAWIESPEPNHVSQYNKWHALHRKFRQALAEVGSK